MRVGVMIAMIVVGCGLGAWLGYSMAMLYVARSRARRREDLASLTLPDLTPTTRGGEIQRARKEIEDSHRRANKVLLDMEREERIRQRIAEEEALRSIRSVAEPQDDPNWKPGDPWTS